MDHWSATDTFNNAYRHLQTHHLQQQQQLLQQQQQQQQQQHYQSQQLYEAPSQTLNPPTSKSLYNVEYLDHGSTLTSVQNAQVLSHLPASSTYQQHSSNAVTDASYSQPWSRNPNSGVYHGEAHVGSSASDYSRQHGWGLEAHRSQLSQHSLEKGLPPGVDATQTAAHYQTLQYAHQAYQLPYAHLQQTANPRPVASSFVWPGKKQVKNAEKKIPAVKSTSMKHTSATTSDGAKGLGWCALCKRDCITEAALKQHLEGKPHKRQVERQTAVAEAATRTAEGAGWAEMLQQMRMQVITTGKQANPKKTGAVGSTNAGNAVPTNATAGPLNVNSKAASGGEALEMFRCELCNVACNSPAVLAVHYGGKKHAFWYKKAQELGLVAQGASGVAQ